MPSPPPSLSIGKAEALGQPTATPCESWQRTAAHIFSVALGLGLLLTGLPPLMIAGAAILMLWMAWAGSRPEPGVLPPPTHSALNTSPN